MEDFTCDCSEEFGPCEDHSELLVSREGASLRTADELSVLFIQDAVSLGVELSVWGKETLGYAQGDLSDNESMGVAWFSDNEAERIQDEIGTLQWQVESELATLGYSVYWEDGFRILKVTGGPLAD